MKRLLAAGVAALAVAAAAGWFLTAPKPLDESAVSGMTGDPEAGRLAFAAGGCASCHIAPDAEASDQPVLSGGQEFASEFGIFIAPNISPDEEHGIGGWTDLQFVNAVKEGIGPDGKHLYPAFPYSSYTRADVQDILDIEAYIRTLPASAEPNQPHQLAFPFSIRRSVGGWKLLFFSDDWVVGGDLTEEQQRGRYLVEGLGHCAECHTPRNALGALDTSQWLAGAPNPSGQGNIPNITPGALDWSAADISAYLESGFTPEFDSAGGDMAHVVENMSQLPASDRDAIAAYLKAVPAVN